MTPDEITPTPSPSVHPDARLIDASGGNTAFALLLGLPMNPATVSRVSQWKRRGIPTDIRTAHADRLRTLRGQATKRGML